MSGDRTIVKGSVRFAAPQTIAMETLIVTIHGTPSPALRDVDIKLTFEHLAKDLVLLKYESLVQRAHIASLTAFANAASERLGLPFNDRDGLHEGKVALTRDEILRELEEYAATIVPFMKGAKFSVKFGPPIGIPVISELPSGSGPHT